MTRSSRRRRNAYARQIARWVLANPALPSAHIERFGAITADDVQFNVRRSGWVTDFQRAEVESEIGPLNVNWSLAAEILNAALHTPKRGRMRYPIYLIDTPPPVYVPRFEA